MTIIGNGERGFSLMTLEGVFAVLCLLISPAFSQQADDSSEKLIESSITENGTTDENELVEVSEIGEANNAIVSSEMQEKKDDGIFSKKMSEKKFSLGVHFISAYCKPTTTDWKGFNTEIGIGVNHFFNPWLAIVTGLDFNFSFFYRKEGNRAIIYREYFQDGKFMDYSSSLDDKDQKLNVYKFSIPIQARFGKMFWIEPGLRLDILFSENFSSDNDKEIGSFNGYYKYEAYDPTEYKSTLIPNLILNLGRSIPIQNILLDLGLHLSYSLSKTLFQDVIIKDIVEESMSTIEIGIVIKAWFI